MKTLKECLKVGST